MVRFLLKLLLKQRILAVHHDFHWLLLATKLLTAKLHSRYVKELVSESEILERPESENSEARSRSRTFHLRLCNAGSNLVQSTPKRISMVLKSKGGHIRYQFRTEQLIIAYSAAVIELKPNHCLTWEFLDFIATVPINLHRTVVVPKQSRVSLLLAHPALYIFKTTKSIKRVVFVSFS